MKCIQEVQLVISEKIKSILNNDENPVCTKEKKITDLICLSTRLHNFMNDSEGDRKGVEG